MCAKVVQFSCLKKQDFFGFSYWFLRLVCLRCRTEKRIFKGMCSSFLKEFRQPCFVPDTLPKFNIAPENAWFQLEDYFPFGKVYIFFEGYVKLRGNNFKENIP